jgi:hypothetical protein
MGETDSLFQLIVFVLIGVAWVLKEVLEQRRAKRRPSRPKAPAGEGEERPDVIVHPHPTRLRPVPVSPPSATDAEHDLSRLAVRELEGGRRVLPSTRAAAAQGAVVLKQRRESAYRRLSGGTDGPPGRDLTRAGVLWSEILGPCRALTGPHRPPHAHRRRSR